jgi:pterin-4a-carbinolamine dehydratase
MQQQVSPSNNPSEPRWSTATTESGRSGAAALLGEGGWKLSRTRDGLEREFVFPGFAKAMLFMNAVADECKLRKHHPEWANVHNIPSLPPMVRYIEMNDDDRRYIGLQHRDRPLDYAQSRRTQR